MWKLYDALITGVSNDIIIDHTAVSDCWTLVKAGDDTGLAMTTRGNTRPPRFDGGFVGRSLRQAAEAAKSWNLDEASFGTAAINAFYNTKTRMAHLRCGEPYKNYCTRGLELSNKTVGLVGHLKIPPEIIAGAQEVYILERHPKAGDYPDPACEYLLPMCDVVIITGSALVNKTLPRLLQLCKNAYTILTGPTAPMCPALLDFGLDRIAGMVVADPAGALRYVEDNVMGPPFTHGQTFLIGRDLP